MSAYGPAAHEPIVLVYAGQMYELLPLVRWPLKVVRKIGLGEVEALADVMVTGDWETLVDSGYTLGDLGELVDRIANDSGGRHP